MSTKFSKIPPQLLRLLILTIAIIISYSIARAVLVPKSWGEYGFYRGDALKEIASREPLFGGAKSCLECHSEEAGVLSKGKHKSISCEACHGPNSAHAQDPDKADPYKMEENICVRCHTQDAAKPAFLKQINPSKHYTGQKCAECHIPHQPNEVP